ncbi:IS1380 family transposase [Streptosporangium sp. NBC_01755]|uniref:IS1380 family transposase n=1 Tax=unclassified Streptosporangium TaxID=2632669 RepID=UPI002DDAD09F|nr:MULTISPECIES: IS1380 family transposase [unclassified Streptosporangium]WSA23539.1 IS1380 family transposase [Streptosporangium sp. NBC_01810]WSC99964.1 IS1380 family transposase [Streptosporangium sp. NBC_01755]
MQFFHDAAKTRAIFDDEHVIAYGGLAPTMRPAERCGLGDLVGAHVTSTARDGVNAPAKVCSIVAGMACGADSIDDLDLLRHGGMDKVFDGIRAPSTLGAFLRAFTWGNVRQLEKVARQVLTALAAHTPLLPGAEVLAFLDIDSMQRRTYGYAKQGAGFGHTKIGGKSVLVRGLNVLAVTLSTPLTAPVVAATRLRGGNAGSARGAASLVRESIPTARQAGCLGTLILRGDSAFYSAEVIGACRGQDTRFSVTAKLDPKVKAAIEAIPETAWTPIKYPRAIWDEQAGGWVSDAEVAETRYTAFASKKGRTVTARLLVRRVKRLNEQAERGQDTLFTTHRHYPIFTDSPYTLVQAEEQHRDHAVQEQVNADLIDGPLAHLPSGRFAANAAWLTLTAITHNLLRALGCLADSFHARARGATLRRHLISVPARIARHGRGHLTVHLPARWRWQHAWMNAFAAAHDPPPALPA